MRYNDEKQNDAEIKIPSPDPRVFGLTKAAYSVRETVDVLSLGRTSIYAAIKRGDLHQVKCGHKTLLLADDLAAFLTRLKSAR